MSTTTMNAMNANLTSVRFAGNISKTGKPSLPSLAMTKFLQARAALPEMPEQESHLAAFAGIALRLVAATVPATAMAWLCLAS